MWRSAASDSPAQQTASTRQNPAATPAPDLVNRDFNAAAPDRLWVANATRTPVARACSGWPRYGTCSPTGSWGGGIRIAANTDLILGALEYAIFSRDVRDQKLIHHSDRGSNLRSFRFSQRLVDHGILASMGSVGDSYDNALMENFFSTLKTELAYRSSWRTRDEAENALFIYIDGWYNRERIQARLGWRSPDEYEAVWHADHVRLDDHPAADAEGPDPAPAR